VLGGFSVPNWCENILRIDGPAADIAEFAQMAKARNQMSKARKKGTSEDEEFDLPLSLNSLVPPPSTLDDDGWYNWRLSNWGTKWDVDVEAKVTVTETSLEYRFDSAWSPPMVWLQTVGSKFPSLHFCLWYAESGCDFGGIYEIEGEYAHHEEMDAVTAYLREYGEYSVICKYCDSDMVIVVADEAHICPNCWDHRCVHCKKLDSEHADGKCLFDSSTFTSLSLASMK
jgi:predicted RNA-binding Zn-ribbon protein involved in translation (DUF1610 family)